MIIDNTKTVNSTKMKMTEAQQKQFDEDGFFLVEDALNPAEVAELIGVMDEAYEHYRHERNLGPYDPFQIRNIVAYHQKFQAMIDHPKILPLVVDAIGYNIQIRTSHMDVRPPHAPDAPRHEIGARESFFPWHADAPNFGWPTVQGLIPFMELKVGYYLTDLTQHNSGAICVVRGSHRLSPWIEQDGHQVVDPERIVEVNVRPGTAMVWRTALFHAVTPNSSKLTRKCLYYGYSHRWLRPSDYDHQPAEIMAGCNAIQRQLLGELGTGDLNYNGDDPLIHPVSRFWRPQNEDIPIKDWAETQLAQPN